MPIPSRPARSTTHRLRNRSAPGPVRRGPAGLPQPTGPSAARPPPARSFRPRAIRRHRPSRRIAPRPSGRLDRVPRPQPHGRSPSAGRGRPGSRCGHRSGSRAPVRVRRARTESNGVLCGAERARRPAASLVVRSLRRTTDMGRFQKSIALAKSSWQVLRDDKQLVVIPLLSLLATVVLAVAVLLPIGLIVRNGSGGYSGSAPLVWVLGFIGSVALTYVVVFFNAALVFAANS